MLQLTLSFIYSNKAGCCCCYCGPHAWKSPSWSTACPRMHTCSAASSALLLLPAFFTTPTPAGQQAGRDRDRESRAELTSSVSIWPGGWVVSLGTSPLQGGDEGTGGRGSAPGVLPGQEDGAGNPPHSPSSTAGKQQQQLLQWHHHGLRFR